MFNWENLLYSSKPLWDVIASMVSNVPLPTPGKDRVLFAIENSLLAVEAPPRDGLPHADVRLSSSCIFLCWCLSLSTHLCIYSCFKVYMFRISVDELQISLQPLVQCLDVDNLIKLFTAVLLERRILLRSNKYVSISKF